MQRDLAAILQVLHQQPETVLSERSKKFLKKALKTGVVTNPNIGSICSSLRCTFCGKVIGDGEFSISQALWEDQFVECGKCGDEHGGWNEEKYEALPQEDKDFMDSLDGKYLSNMTQDEGERLNRLTDQCYDWPDEEEVKQFEEQWSRELRAAEKIVYPEGRNKRAHWEKLLKHRRIPLVPKHIE